MSYQPALNRRLFKNELRTYFGLNQAQADSVEAKWNEFYNKGYAIIVLTLPSNYHDN